MRILAIAPMPTHPAVQGNRQRAFDLCRSFQRRGAQITFLYWAAEGLDGNAADLMRAAWDDVVILPPDGFRERRSFGPFYGIDDWYDERIGGKIAKLCATRHFDLCLVNYVWLSAAFTHLPPDCLRVIDTHDLFGGRADHFYVRNAAPDWYYTSVPEEARGLDRADIVLAIQREEAVLLRQRTSTEVTTIGFLSRPIPTLRRAAAVPGRVTVGYIGSANPFNVASVLEFCAALRTVDLPRTVDFVAAGPICHVLRTLNDQPFTLLGIVDEIDHFYEQIDISINPMVGGTGLKIKTIEALAHGVAVIGTPDAFAGIASPVPAHQCADSAAIVAHLAAFLAAPETVADLRDASRSVYRAYLREQRDAFDDLYDRVERHLAAQPA